MFTGGTGFCPMAMWVWLKRLNDRRGKLQVLVHVFTYQGNPFWYRFIEPQPCGLCCFGAKGTLQDSMLFFLKLGMNPKDHTNQEWLFFREFRGVPRIRIVLISLKLTCYLVSNSSVRCTTSLPVFWLFTMFDIFQHLQMFAPMGGRATRLYRFLSRSCLSRLPIASRSSERVCKTGGAGGCHLTLLDLQDGGGVNPIMSLSYQ